MNAELYVNQLNDNPLAEFGQRPTPQAGSTIKRVVVKNDDHTGYFDRIKDRYVWFPFQDVSFIGKMVQQPMSFDYLYRGRIGWVQPVAYRAIDNSAEAFDTPGDEELNLKTFILTPFAQCVYLHLNWADQGMRIFEHLKNEPPELVQHIEEVILPEVPTNLIDLGEYLTQQSGNNIANASLDARTRELAFQTLASMIEGVNTAVKYARTLIAETENELLTRRNKGVGKSSLDNNDRFAYHSIKRRVPTETTLENAPERVTNELLEQLVNAIVGRKAGEVSPVVVTPVGDEREGEIRDLKQRLAEMEALVQRALNAKPADDGAPKLEDSKVATPEEVQEDLKTRLNNPRNNQGNKPGQNRR